MRGFVSAACLGLACYLLQPHQPQSAIAVLLIIASVNIKE